MCDLWKTFYLSTDFHLLQVLRRQKFSMGHLTCSVHVCINKNPSKIQKEKNSKYHTRVTLQYDIAPDKGKMQREFQRELWREADQQESHPFVSLPS